MLFTRNDSQFSVKLQNSCELCEWTICHSRHAYSKILCIEQLRWHILKMQHRLPLHIGFVVQTVIDCPCRMQVNFSFSLNEPSKSLFSLGYIRTETLTETDFTQSLVLRCWVKAVMQWKENVKHTCNVFFIEVHLTALSNSLMSDLSLQHTHSYEFLTDHQCMLSKGHPFAWHPSLHMRAASVRAVSTGKPCSTGTPMLRGTFIRYVSTSQSLVSVIWVVLCLPSRWFMEPLVVTPVY